MVVLKKKWFEEYNFCPYTEGFVKNEQFVTEHRNMLSLGTSVFNYTRKANIKHKKIMV